VIRPFIGYHFQEYLEVENNILFNIKNLNCSYKTSERPVLEIEELLIERGDRVIFIGPSGVGKSTILESLGLMNNTLDNDGDKGNRPPKFQMNYIDANEYKTENFLDVWDKRERDLSALRNKVFSFIFQSNNLFNSMTGYQNIKSGSIINGMDSDKAKKEAEALIEELLTDLKLENDDDFNILKISGGQRQRVAFARAIIANKQILFADEPTGNLDWWNAEKLMMYLDEKLGSDKTAIIVTHDIELALKFASKIVMVHKKYDKEKDSYYGVINDTSVYVKHDLEWKNLGINKKMTRVRKELKEMFIPISHK